MIQWKLGDDNSFPPYQRSIADVLRQEANYETAVFGKWHLGSKVPPDGIKSKENIITDIRHNWTLPVMKGAGYLGFEHSYISPGGIQAMPYAYFRNDHLTIDPSNATFWKTGFYNMSGGTSQIPKEGQGDPNWDSTMYNMVIVNETRDFITNHIENGRDNPFFVYAALGTVHIPHTPPDVYLDGSPIKNQYKNNHLDLLLEMDKVVGSIISIVEENELQEDTIIIFTSDNGGLSKSRRFGHKSSGPLHGYKGTVYEGGHRVPLVIRYDKKFPAAEKRNKLVAINNIYATLCELTGIKKPIRSALDSISFAKYIINASDTTDIRQNFVTFHDSSIKEERLFAHTIIENDTKLIHFPRNDTFFMFDLKVDLSERNNIFESANLCEVRSVQIVPKA